jgi:hypothetical protein
MKTRNFINMLVEDYNVKCHAFYKQSIINIALGIAFSFVIFNIFFQIRNDFYFAIFQPFVIFKFFFTACIIGSLYPILKSILFPENNLYSKLYWLCLPILILLIGVVFQLFNSPEYEWYSGMIGLYPLQCLKNIPILSLGPFIAILLFIRGHAPTQPALSGALSGAISAGIGSLMYAFHCPDDSALFVATWYSFAISIMTIFGALIGFKWLRW